MIKINIITGRHIGLPLHILLFLCSLYIPLYAEDVARIIAKVNNQVITSKDLDDYSQAVQYRLSDSEPDVSVQTPEFRKQNLRRLIEDKLILEEAKKEKIVIPLGMIDERLNQIIASHHSRAEFEESLRQKGITVTQLKEKIKEQYLMREIIKNKVRFLISVLPQEVSAYYAQNQDQMYSPSAYFFYLATAKDKGHLVKIAKVISLDGLDKALNDYPKDLIRLESTQDELRPQIAAVVIRLKKSETEIAKIDDLYYLIHLEEISEPELLSLSEAQENIYAYLFDKKFKEKFTAWASSLEEKAVIKIYEEH